MRTYLLALAMLCGISWHASAEYLVIKVDVNRSFVDGPSDSKQAGGVLSPKRLIKQGTNPALPMGPGARFAPGGNMPPMPPVLGKPPIPGKPGVKVGAAPMPARWAYAYLELPAQPQPVPLFTKDKLTHIAIAHPWGRLCFVPVESLFLIRGKESPVTEFGRREKALNKEGRTPLKVMRLAGWALSHGLMKEFHRTMDSLQKVNEMPADVKSVLDAYLLVKTGLAKAPDQTDPAQANLIAGFKNDGYQPIPTPHYLLLTNVASTANNALKRRLTLLEDSYEKFYYWFALHSPKAVPLPKHKLLAALVASGKEFQNKNVAWGAVPIIEDAFVPRRDNILVMSAEHLDDTYTSLKRNNLNYYQSLRIGRDELLTGAVWNRGDAKQNDLNVALLQTLTLVQKATEEEAERATISHGVTRQLLFAADFLPRNVDTPEWIQYGLASFFETPKGAFFPGVGMPSWTNLLDFKHHRRKSNLGTPKDVLDQVITDGYFRKARASAALVQPGQEKRAALEERANRDREIARSTAWALIYYLAKEQKLHSVLQFTEQLKKLPRDLDLNEQVLRGSFKQAFELTDAQVQSFADAWFAEMQNYLLPMPSQYEQVLLQSRDAPDPSAETQADPTGKNTVP